jgi:hypothetical protein
MIQDTSLHAYALLTQNLTDRQKEVLDRLRYFPDVTNMELAVSMGWTVNRVTGRVGELRKLGLVLDAGKRRCKITNGISHIWKAKYPVLPPAFIAKPKDEINQSTLFNQ